MNNEHPTTNSDEFRLIFIGDHFYSRSSTMMSSIYREADGGRSDWGKVKVALREGREVHIRPATAAEIEPYGKQLAELEAKFEAQKDAKC